MTTGIKEKKQPSQQPGAGLNLGGPTTHLLASTEKEFYRKWADRYAILNGWSQ